MEKRSVSFVEETQTGFEEDEDESSYEEESSSSTPRVEGRPHEAELAALYAGVPSGVARVFGVAELSQLVFAHLDDASLVSAALSCRLFDAMLSDPLFWTRRYRARWRRMRSHRVRRRARGEGLSIRQLYGLDVLREARLRAALVGQRWFDVVARLVYEAIPTPGGYDIRYATLAEAQASARSGEGSASSLPVYWIRHPRSRTTSLSIPGGSGAGSSSGNINININANINSSANVSDDDSVAESVDSSVSTHSAVSTLSTLSTMSTVSAVSTVSTVSAVSTMSGLSVLSMMTNTSDTTIIPYTRGQLELVTPSSFSLNGVEFVLELIEEIDIIDVDDVDVGGRASLLSDDGSLSRGDDDGDQEDQVDHDDGVDDDDVDNDDNDGQDYHGHVGDSLTDGETAPVEPASENATTVTYHVEFVNRRNRRHRLVPLSYVPFDEPIDDICSSDDDGHGL